MLLELVTFWVSFWRERVASLSSAIMIPESFLSGVVEGVLELNMCSFFAIPIIRSISVICLYVPKFFFVY